MDSATQGYITALISNEQMKTFTVSAAGAKVTDSGTVQPIAGMRLKLTQARAKYLDAGLHKQALKAYSQFGTLDLRLLKPAASPGGGGTPGQGTAPGGTVTGAPGLLAAFPGGGQVAALLPGTTLDLDGDGRPDAGASALPLQSVAFDTTTKTGDVKLAGGISLLGPDGSTLSLTDPEVVLGATAD